MAKQCAARSIPSGAPYSGAQRGELAPSASYRTTLSQQPPRHTSAGRQQDSPLGGGVGGLDGARSAFSTPRPRPVSELAER